MSQLTWILTRCFRGRSTGVAGVQELQNGTGDFQFINASALMHSVLISFVYPLPGSCTPATPSRQIFCW